MNYEFAKNYTVNAEGRKAIIAGIEKQLDAKVITSGLGVSPGKFTFATPNAAEIFGCKPVESAKGKFNLTFVSGTLKGAEASNKSTEKTFDLEKSLFVVSSDQWEKMLPNQRYDVVITDKGRVGSVALIAGEGTLTEAKAPKGKKATV